MSKNPHKGFQLEPFAASLPDGTALDLGEVLNQLSDDVWNLTDMTEWHVDWGLLHQFQLLPEKKQNQKSNSLGHEMSIHVIDGVLKEWKSGKSRFEMMLQQNAIDLVKSWDARIQASKGKPKGYMSQGWKRTVNPNKPTNLKPKLPLNATDKHYSRVINDPLQNNPDVLILEMVIGGQWIRLYFQFPYRRFKGAKRLTKPTITVNKFGYPQFNFAVVYEYIYTVFSEEYVIGVDIGLTNYATVSVVRVDTGEVVETTTLSAEVHALNNRVRNANIQIASLQKQGRKEEARLHRVANVRRKQELAILAAKEIAALSAKWHNAIVVVERLDWIEDTMRNGRWNRGAFVAWLEHSVELNGGRAARVSAKNTSQLCHQCGHQLSFHEWHDAYCPHCDMWMDRDWNATINIALRFTDPEQGKFESYVESRKKAKNATTRQVQRVKPKPQTKRKRPKSRDKLGPTPKQKKCRKPKTKVFTNGGLGVTKRSGSPQLMVERGGDEKVRSSRDCYKQPPKNLNHTSTTDVHNKFFTVQRVSPV